MARGPTTFRQRDMTAAIKAAIAAGCAVARVRVAKDGEIVVEIATSDSPIIDPAGAAKEWDDLLP